MAMHTKIQASHIYDVIGVGIGPFNLGLAALLTKTTEIDTLFFEQKAKFDWHQGMLIEGTTLQVPFMADLVTMADPTNPFSFLNYLKAHDRLYAFYFFESFHIPRREYNHYCQWVAEQLSSCCFGFTVNSVELVETEQGTCYRLTVEERETGLSSVYFSRHLVLGVGTAPQAGSGANPVKPGKLFHSSSYLEQREACRQSRSITIIGSGQSAAEVFYDLLQSQEACGYELNWLTRSRGFFPMEYSKLGLEHFSPDYTQYFYSLPPSVKDHVLKRQDLLYKGISAKTIANIYDELYHASCCGVRPRVRLLSLTEVREVSSVSGEMGETYELSCLQIEQEALWKLHSETIIYATGYRYTIPACLNGIHHHIAWDDAGRYQVSANYRIEQGGGEASENRIYVQNGELHTHGVSAPDLGLGAHRNAVIINDLLGRTLYPVAERNVFQQFGAQ